MKRLTRIRLINWHRFENETIPIAESVVLSGENGAGKSTILDAIQYVITCTKQNFNKAAHEKGKRNLTGYIRCKTGREDKPYERSGAISAHIALEFFDEARKAPFVVGCVMDSISEEKEPNTAWYLLEKRTITDDLFFTGRTVKSISAFRAANKGIRTFAQTQAEARKMMLARFGRLEDKFFTLIPKALAFRPIHDIKDFVYSYVLDAKEVNIDALRENVRSYQDLERMLTDVRQRMGELESIISIEGEVEAALRRDRFQEYYIARAGADITEKMCADTASGLRRIDAELKEVAQRRSDSEEERDSKERTIRDLSAELLSDSEYQVFRELEREEAALKAAIAQDKAEVKDLVVAAGKARKLAETLLSVQDAAPCVRSYADILLDIRSAPSIADVSVLLEDVITWKQDMFRKVSASQARYQVKISDEREKLGELNGKIRQLEAKQLVYRPEVLTLRRRISEQLTRLGRRGDVRILCEMLEITDASWQNAIEGYLNTQRFYLLVEPEDYDIAVSVYDTLRRQRKVYGVGLINTEKLEGYDQAPEGSLARFVTSKNIWARRYVNLVLGKVHCCTSYQELKNYPTSITKGCMRYQNHVVSAIRPEIFETPYIGAEAYRVQLEKCRLEADAIEKEIADLRKKAEAITRIISSLETAADIDVKYSLRALENERSHTSALEKCRGEMKTLKASQTLILKRVRLEELEREKAKLDRTITQLGEEIGSLRARSEAMEKQLQDLAAVREEEIASIAGLADRLGEDLPFCDREYEKQTAGKDLEKYRENFESARKGNWTRKESAERRMIEEMNRYKIAHDFGAAATLAGFPDFASEYDKLKNSQLLEYEDKVARARAAAEEEFREQFLSRLQENIRQAHGEFRALNNALADIHFSRETYEFRCEPHRRYKKFYDMIMDDFNAMQGVSIFSGVFNEQHREAIEELFERLTIDDESSAQVLEEYTDYRTYMDYDIKISLDDGSYMYYSKVSREKSGGETQTPFYITIAASFIQLYKNSIGGDAIGLILLDEAFNNMDDERISGVLSFMTQAGLQMIIAVPPDKIQLIAPSMKSVLLVLPDGPTSYVEDFTHE